MRIITVSNSKGGVGKTTTAHAIITGAAARGRRVLGVDFDVQGNLSYTMGADTSKGGVYELIQGTPARRLIQHTAQGDILTGSMNIATITTGGKLKGAIRPLATLYDLIVVDSPPTLGAALGNALEAATDVLIPLQADPLCLHGLYQIVTTTRHYNPDAVMLGAFLLRYNPRSIINRNMADAIRAKCEELNIPFIDTPVRESVAVREAQAMQTSLFTYAPKAKVTADFTALLDAIRI